MSFAGRLKIARKEKGYSQEALAEKLEVSRQSITKWETGTAFPELKKLLLLSVVLDKELDWMLCDERNALHMNREAAFMTLNDDCQICDMKSLIMAVRDRQIRRMLECLDGTIFTEKVEEEAFQGNRTYVVFDSRMFTAGNGIAPKTGAHQEFFMELKPTEAVEILIRHVQNFGILQEGDI